MRVGAGCASEENRGGRIASSALCCVQHRRRTPGKSFGFCADIKRRINPGRSSSRRL